MGVVRHPIAADYARRPIREGVRTLDRRKAMHRGHGKREQHDDPEQASQYPQDGHAESVMAERLHGVSWHY